MPQHRTIPFRFFSPATTLQMSKFTMILLLIYPPTTSPPVSEFTPETLLLAVTISGLPNKVISGPRVHGLVPPRGSGFFSGRSDSELMQLCHHSLLYYSASLRSLCNVISTCCARGSILLPTSRTVLSFTRNMSSSPTKHLFAIHAPDYTEPGTLDRRTSAREEHLKGIKGLKSSGIASMCSLPAVPPTMTTFFFLRRIWGRPLGARTGR